MNHQHWAEFKALFLSMFSGAVSLPQVTTRSRRCHTLRKRASASDCGHHLCHGRCQQLQISTETSKMHPNAKDWKPNHSWPAADVALHCAALRWMSQHPNTSRPGSAGIKMNKTCSHFAVLSFKPCATRGQTQQANAQLLCEKPNQSISL